MRGSRFGRLPHPWCLSAGGCQERRFLTHLSGANCVPGTARCRLPWSPLLEVEGGPKGSRAGEEWRPEPRGHTGSS